jgi:hypothetical protein
LQRPASSLSAKVLRCVLPPREREKVGLTARQTAWEVPAAVRALLAASRTLQDKLRLWALEKASETDVSDCYVAIGNEFNGTINAFAAHDTDLRCVCAHPLLLSSLVSDGDWIARYTACRKSCARSSRAAWARTRARRC